MEIQALRINERAAAVNRNIGVQPAHFAPIVSTGTGDSRTIFSATLPTSAC